MVTDNEMYDPVFPNGCAMCELEVDPDTGAVELTRYASVDDVGRCINPLIVHGQTHGAIAQGVGQALWEQCYVERDSGQPLIGSLMDYGLPRADTLPPLATEIAEVLSPTNPLGIKAGAGMYSITGLSTFFGGNDQTTPVAFRLEEGNSEQSDATTPFDVNGTGTTRAGTGR